MKTKSRKFELEDLQRFAVNKVDQSIPGQEFIREELQGKFSATSEMINLDTESPIIIELY